jgi:hypothetical protein
MVNPTTLWGQPEVTFSGPIAPGLPVKGVRILNRRGVAVSEVSAIHAMPTAGSVFAATGGQRFLLASPTGRSVWLLLSSADIAVA